MGEMSNRVAEAAKTRRAALERGKHVAQDAADSATEQGQELVSSLQGTRPGLARPSAQHGLGERARAWGPLAHLRLVRDTTSDDGPWVRPTGAARELRACYFGHGSG
jgi:hypothetical protein